MKITLGTGDIMQNVLFFLILKPQNPRVPRCSLSKSQMQSHPRVLLLLTLLIPSSLWYWVSMFSPDAETNACYRVWGESSWGHATQCQSHSYCWEPGLCPKCLALMEVLFHLQQESVCCRAMGFLFCKTDKTTKVSVAFPIWTLWQYLTSGFHQARKAWSW